MQFHGHERVAPAQCHQHILQGGSLWRTDNNDVLDGLREWFLALGLEQALGLQFVLQPLERSGQCAVAGVLHGIDDQLQVATWGVDRQPPVGNDLLAFAQRLPANAGAKPRAANLPVQVLE